MIYGEFLKRKSFKNRFLKMTSDAQQLIEKVWDPTIESHNNKQMLYQIH